MKVDLDTNPMKPITRMNLGKNWEKGSGGKYKPHMGNKEKWKAERTRAKRAMALGLNISGLDAVNFKLKMELVRRGYKSAIDGDYYVKSAAVKTPDVSSRTEDAEGSSEN